MAQQWEAENMNGLQLTLLNLLFPPTKKKSQGITKPEELHGKALTSPHLEAVTHPVTSRTSHGCLNFNHYIYKDCFLHINSTFSHNITHDNQLSFTYTTFINHHVDLEHCVL